MLFTKPVLNYLKNDFKFLTFLLIMALFCSLYSMAHIYFYIILKIFKFFNHGFRIEITFYFKLNFFPNLRKEKFFVNIILYL